MKIKKLLSTFLLLFIVLALSAQEKATVSGRIFDSETGLPMPFVTVSLNQEGKMITGLISDNDGRFVISGIDQGSYIVKCTFVGYQAVEIPLLAGKLNQLYDLGKIELTVAVEALDEVIVNARRSLLSSNLDKKSFQIDENIAQSGGSVLDIMKTMAGVTVDQEGKILLRGSDKVVVLIDGKQSSLTGFGNQKGLEGIPVSNIETIEIINNPSARYDAAGMAGIINIIYKKENETGFNGDISLSGGLGALTRSRNDLATQLGSYSINPKIVPALNLNYKTKSLIFHLRTEMKYQEALPNNEFTTRLYDNGTRTASQVPENRKQTHYVSSGGFDWLINDNDMITFAAVYDYESHHDTAQVPYYNLGTGERYRYWTWLEYEITGYMNYSVSYLHKFAEPGHELEVGIQYTRGWEDESYFLNDSSEFRISHDTTHIIATEHVTNLVVDYTKPLKNGRIEAGSKFQLRRIPVTYTTGKGVATVIYPDLGDWSDWGEDIYAGYLNWIFERPLFDIEAGVRAEYTSIFYEIAPENTYYPQNDKYDYFKFFPNLRLTYKLNNSINFSAFYNRRIDRPGEPELRIFPKYDDPELLKVGNPYLRPQFTQTFELASKFRWNSGSLFLSAYQRITENPYQRIYSIDSSGGLYDIVNKIYQNAGRGTSTGTEIILSQNVAKGWKMSGSFNWYNNIIGAFEGTLHFPYERTFSIEESRDNTWDAKFNNTFELPFKTSLQLTGIWYAPRNIPQGSQLGRSSIDLGIKKVILKGKGEVTFSFSDLFNDFGIRQRITGDGFTVIYENLYETQVAMIGFKYKF